MEASEWAEEVVVWFVSFYLMSPDSCLKTIEIDMCSNNDQDTVEMMLRFPFRNTCIRYFSSAVSVNPGVNRSSVTEPRLGWFGED